MMKMARRPSFRNAKNIQARLRIDPQSLAQFNAALKRLEQVTRKDVVTKALAAGGSIIHNAAEQKAPGPFIEYQVMYGKELMRKWRSAGAQGIKPDALYVAIGPDKDHWYYRFAEFGVQAHGVKKRKRTRGEITARQRQGRAEYRNIRRQFAGRSPAMAFYVDGKLIFARKVRGQPKKPFLRPAADSQGNAAIAAVGAVMKSEIEKAARA